MRQRRTMLGLASMLGIAACLYFGAPPSDETLLATFQRQPAIHQIVAMYHEDQQGMAINANGTALTERALPAARLAAYRALLQQAGVSWTTGGPDAVTLHFPAALDLPSLPVKSLVYTLTPPDVLTTERTDAYRFQPGQYQRVCRRIEPHWYLCKDNED